MKSEIKVVPHAVLPNHNVVEVWYDGKFIATITGLDGAGVRVISKHLVDKDFHIHTEMSPNRREPGFVAIVFNHEKIH